MKIALFTDENRHELLAELMPGISCTGGISHWEHYRTYDEFIRELPRGIWDAVVVAIAGANGMESVRAARTLCPRIPLIWLSDDKGFGPESYRVGCSFFSASPVTAELLEKALFRCRKTS